MGFAHGRKESTMRLAQTARAVCQGESLEVYGDRSEEEADTEADEKTGENMNQLYTSLFMF
jgi:hypothetical protein